jgi:hypothetical protein
MMAIAAVSVIGMLLVIVSIPLCCWWVYETFLSHTL